MSLRIHAVCSEHMQSKEVDEGSGQSFYLYPQYIVAYACFKNVLTPDPLCCADVFASYRWRHFVEMYEKWDLTSILSKTFKHDSLMTFA